MVPPFFVPSSQAHQLFQLQQGLVEVVIDHHSIEFVLGA